MRQKSTAMASLMLRTVKMAFMWCWCVYTFPYIENNGIGSNISMAWNLSMDNTMYRKIIMNNQHFSKLNYFRQSIRNSSSASDDMRRIVVSVSAFDVSKQNKINESYYVWLIGWCFNSVKGTRNDTVCVCVRVRWASEPNGNSSNFASRLRWKPKPKEVNMKGANTHTQTEICCSQAENAPEEIDRQHGFDMEQ